jgi:hypothetical protein
MPLKKHAFCYIYFTKLINSYTPTSGVLLQGTSLTMVEKYENYVQKLIYVLT